MSNQQPIYIMPQDTQRTLGRDAQRNNILAAKLVAETVRTTLGPKGMDKMIVDAMGDVVVTNDGVTVLEEMQIEHPTAKMIVEVAKTQDDQVGDGTTTAVILSGELLKNAEHLLDQNVHPTVIIKGYGLAAEKAQAILSEMAETITAADKDKLRNIITTAITGKGAEASKEKLADILLEAIETVGLNKDDIKIEKKTGGSTEESELIKGIVLDKERVHSSMPQKLGDVKIALLDCAIEIKETEADTKIQVTDPSQLQAFIDREERSLKEMVEKIVATGAKAVFCQKGIDDIAQYYLSKAGIYAARRVAKSDLEKLARATGATIISKINELTSLQLGYAGTVEEQKIGDEEMTYIKGCRNPKSVTILLRGGTTHVLAESERAIKDALGDVVAALESGKVVGGAGAAEMELAKKLREYATSLSGREQLAALAFADAIEVVPRTLAENAGLDPIDMLTELKARHDEGIKWAGLDVFEGKVVNSWEKGIIEPLKLKLQAIKSANEVAQLILRIDDVIAGGSKKAGPQMPPMGMGGMPQM
ncbi:MAG: thermosome subunit alpha [archaeon]